MKEKRLLKIGIIGLLVFILAGCSDNQNNLLKTEYLKNEEATIDHYEISYQGYSASTGSANRNRLHVYFEITNNSKETKYINLVEDFDLYTWNSEIIENLYKEEIIEIKNNETKKVTVVYETDDLFENGNLIDLSRYRMIFYSNVVTNNVAFVIEE